MDLDFSFSVMSFLTINKSTSVTKVEFTVNKMILFIDDGREISFPLEWFPALSKATLTQLNNWRLVGNGKGIHWEDLDENISVEKLLE